MIDTRYVWKIYLKNKPQNKSHYSCPLGRCIPDVQYISNKLKKYKNKIYIVEDACMGLAENIKIKNLNNDIGALVSTL